ncbi:hypothetical protein AB0D14_40495 [Streptomyces sp. NPDC048484]|uniref:hypothetical protein n=1 Tax=Streptomyces sp. NPDC048484 TaxID=3155146 RepID=UPI0034358815
MASLEVKFSVFVLLMLAASAIFILWGVNKGDYLMLALGIGAAICGLFLGIKMVLRKASR